MFSHLSRSVIGLVLFFVFLAGTASSSWGRADVGNTNALKIGAVLALTGSESRFGEGTRRGIELAIEEVNAKGGIQGRNVQLFLKDSRGSVEGAKKSIQELIESHHVMAVLGSVASSRSLAMAPIAQAHQTPLISPSSTHPKVTQVGDYIFRVCFIDPFQGAVMARFVKDVLKKKRVAILKNQTNEYSVSLAEYFKEKFVELGGEITTVQSYRSGSVDFSKSLNRIRKSKPELIYLPGYYSEIGLVVGQARKMNIDLPFAGSDGWDATDFFQSQKDILEGSYYTGHYWPHTGDSRLRTFVKKFKNRFRVVPDALAALGYDATRVLLESLKKVPNLDRTVLKNTIAKTKDFPGVTGSITLDENRDAIKPALVFQVSNGERKYLQQVMP